MRNISNTSNCLFPYMYINLIDPCVISLDNEEFKSSIFQRVFQYLQRYINCMQLERFTYQQKKIEGRPMECLEVLLK